MAANSRKAANSFLPLYGGDYLRDTMGNSPAHDGIYFRLLIHYWHAQAPLPEDVSKVRRIARVSGPNEEQILDDILRDFFRFSPGIGWKNKRMDAEIEKATRLKRKRKKAGKAGAKSRWQSDDTTHGKRITKGSPATATATKGEVNPTSPLNPLRGDGSADAPGSDLAGPRPEPDKPTAPSESAYRHAIKTRYHADPGPLNKKQRGQLAMMLGRIPRDDAPAIVEHYVLMDGPRGSLYANARHPIDLLLRDCESIRLAWQTKDVARAAGPPWYRVDYPQRTEEFAKRGREHGLAVPSRGNSSDDFAAFYAAVWVRAEPGKPWHDPTNVAMTELVETARRKMNLKVVG